MKQIKAAIFDIDNTLVKRGHQSILPEVLESIKILQSKGIEIVVATGRAYYFIIDQIKDELKPNYTVCINGGAIYEDGQLFYHLPMDNDEVNTIIDYSRNNDIGLGYKCLDKVYVFNDVNDYKHLYLKGFSNPNILVDATQQEKVTRVDSAPIGAYLIGDHDRMEKMIPMTPNTAWMVATPHSYDIFHKNAGKETALEHVLQRLKITWDNCIVFGDSANDVQMIKLARIGVCMGDGTEDAKKAADYVTKPLMELGIKTALEHFKLI